MACSCFPYSRLDERFTLFVGHAVGADTVLCLWGRQIDGDMRYKAAGFESVVALFRSIVSPKGPASDLAEPARGQDSGNVREPQNMVWGFGLCRRGSLLSGQVVNQRGVSRGGVSTVEVANTETRSGCGSSLQTFRRGIPSALFGTGRLFGELHGVDQGQYRRPLLPLRKSRGSSQIQPLTRSSTSTKTDSL